MSCQTPSTSNAAGTMTTRTNTTAFVSTTTTATTTTTTTTLPPIRIPGNFIVGQGIAGADPLINTMTPPKDLPHVVQAEVAAGEMSSLQGNDHKSTFSSPPIQACFDEWRQALPLQAWQQWQEQTARQGRRRRSRPLDVDQSASTDIENNCWWRHAESGCLATFDALPTISHDDGGCSMRPTGFLPPGTPVRGLEIHAWKKQQTASAASLEFTKLLPVDGARKRKLFPWNRTTDTNGEVLVLKFATLPSLSTRKGHANNQERPQEQPQPSPKIGYCVYSIDGYPYLYPGNIDDYANIYMKEHWYWKVVGDQGVAVFDTSSLSSGNDDNEVSNNSKAAVRIPYGSTIEVTGCKAAGPDGEKRLLVTAFLWNSSGYQKVKGWCRACNDIGQAPVVVPLPCAVPVLLEVVVKAGEYMTTDLDPYSRPYFYAPHRSWITVTHRAFSNRPHKHTGDFAERLRVAGCGWITRRRVVDRKKDGDDTDDVAYNYKSVVRVESWDSWFDPAAPEVFHYLFLRNFCTKIERQKKEKLKQHEAERIPLDILIPMDGATLQSDSTGDEEEEGKQDNHQHHHEGSK